MVCAIAPSSLIFPRGGLGARRPREVRARRGAIDGGTSAFPLTGFGSAYADWARRDGERRAYGPLEGFHMTAATGLSRPDRHMTILWENYELTAP